MKNISGRHPFLLQAWKRAGASKISVVFFFFFQSHQLVYYKALSFSTYYTWCPTSSRPGPYLECRISGLVTVLSTSNTTVRCGYCLKQRIPALLMTKRSMKLNLQLFPLSSKFNQSKFFGKKVNKKTQEIKHKSGNLPRGEEQKGRELAGFITKYTLC